MEEVDYERLFKLFRDPTTRGLVDRHVAVTKRAAAQRADGVPYKELKEVTELLEILNDGLSNGVSEYEEPLCHWLRQLAKPFIRTAASEEYRAVPAIVGMIQTFTALLQAPSATVQFEAAQCLLHFAEGRESNATGAIDRDSDKQSAWDFNHEMLAQAQVLGTIVDAAHGEVAELAAYDANEDGEVDKGEYHRFKVMNDGNADNDDETLQAAQKQRSEENGYDEEKKQSQATPHHKRRVTMESSAVEGEERLIVVPHFLSTVFKIIKELSVSASNAAELCRLGVAAITAEFLGLVADVREEVVSVGIEVLWNLLEHSWASLQVSRGGVALTLSALLDKHRYANAAYQLGTLDAFTNLQVLFDRLIEHGYRAREKAMRNDLIIIFTLLARRPANKRLFVQTGLLHDLLYYGSICEAEPQLRHPYFDTVDALDIQFKHLVWDLLVLLCTGEGGSDRVPLMPGVAGTLHGTITSPNKLGDLDAPGSGNEEERSCIDIMRSSEFLAVLILYLDPLALNNAYLSTLSPAQRRELELHAFRALRLLLPYGFRESFASARGPEVVLTYIRVQSPLLRPLHPDIIRSVNMMAPGVNPEELDALLDDADPGVKLAHRLSPKKRMTTFTRGNAAPEKAADNPGLVMLGIDLATSDSRSVGDMERLCAALQLLQLACTRPLEGKGAYNAPEVGAVETEAAGVLVSPRSGKRDAAPSKKDSAIPDLMMNTEPAFLKALSDRQVGHDDEEEEGQEQQEEGTGNKPLMTAEAASIELALELVSQGGGVEDLTRLVGSFDASENSAVSSAAAVTATVTPAPGTVMTRTITGGGIGVAASTKASLANASTVTASTPDLAEGCFSVLATLCSGNARNQDAFRHARGLAVLQPWLRYSPEDAVAKPLTVLAVVSCLRDAVIGNQRSEARFIAENGIDAVLDLMEAAPAAVRSQVVSAVADLAKNALTHPYIRAWRSDRNGKSVGSYIALFWEEEERRLGLQRGPYGQLSTPDDPLGLAAFVSANGTGGAPTPRASSPGEEDKRGVLGTEAPAFHRLKRALHAAKMWQQVERGTDGSGGAAARLQAGDLRPMLASLLTVFGYENAVDALPKEVTIDEAVGGSGVTFHDVTARERCFLALGAVYPSIARGMAWKSIAQSLQRDGVVPIEADATELQSHIEEFQAYMRQLNEVHDELHVIAMGEDAKTEDAFMKTIAARRQAEEEAYRFQNRGPPQNAAAMQDWVKAKTRKAEMLRNARK